MFDQEPGALPFSPRRIRSQFQHVFIIVKAINPCTENTQYSVAVSRSKEVPIFGPPIPAGATFNKGKAFADFILAKVINAENAAHRYIIVYCLLFKILHLNETIRSTKKNNNDFSDRKNLQLWRRERDKNT